MVDRRRQILEFAVAKETAAKEFYARWAERCTDEELAQVLRDLESEEQSHIEKLSNITPEALMGEGIAPTEFGLVKDLPEVPDESEMHVLDVLAVGIRREEQAVDLYERMRAASTEEALFSALIEEERRHKHRLELQYALLKRRG